MTQLPNGFLELVKRHNPHITELELSRYFNPYAAAGSGCILLKAMTSAIWQGQVPMCSIVDASRWDAIVTLSFRQVCMAKTMNEHLVTMQLQRTSIMAAANQRVQEQSTKHA